MILMDAPLNSTEPFWDGGVLVVLEIPNFSWRDRWFPKDLAKGVS